MTTVERARKAIEALRGPDASLARVPNTVRQSIAETIETLITPVGEGRDPCECPKCGRNHWRLGAPPARPAASLAETTWAYIERLLHDECGLMMDCGLVGQRANCINAIKNGLPDEALTAAAIEFLKSGEGLHKIRVNGKMMTRKDVAAALSRS